MEVNTSKKALSEAAGQAGQILGQAQLASALEQIAEAILITDRDGVIEFVNPAFERITGWPREEALGCKPNLLKSGRQDQAFYRTLWQTILGGTPWHGRFINKKKDGSLYEQIATITPLRDERGAVTHFIGVQMDMAHQLELERQLRQAERLAGIGETIAGVAHNVKNIMQTLKGSAYVIEDALEKRDTDQIRTIWAIYANNSERLFQLTRKMLSYVKGSESNLEPVDANAVIRDVCEACAASAVKRKVNLALELAEGLPRVPCDRAALFDVVMNLVGNAIDACGKRGFGAVSVRTLDDAAAGRIRIQVEDNGPGIAPENLTRIFDPFFSTKGNKGSGLGLAMVQKTMNEYGGSVAVESDPRRTIFTLCLPL